MLLHKLALRMGRRVPELTAEMTNGELASWFAFDRMSPIGDERTDFLFARLMLLVCDAAGLKPKSGGRFAFEDFLLWKPKQKPMTDKELFMSMFSHRIVKKAA